MKCSCSKETPFEFKQFTVCHSHSSMKVGTDAVLIGIWGNTEGLRGLDIGCGCGLIALIAAQKNFQALIDAIDIDPLSIQEARNNFSLSKWDSRIKAFECDANEFGSKYNRLGFYDFIISNPPYFASGIKNPQTSREKARHISSLSPEILVNLSEKLLKPEGHLSIILPYHEFDPEKIQKGLSILKICMVRNKRNAPPKRMMILFQKRKIPNKMENILIDELYIRDENGKYNIKYKELTEDFYLDRAFK